MTKLCNIKDNGILCREEVEPGRRVCRNHNNLRRRELKGKNRVLYKQVVRPEMHNVPMIHNLNSSQYMSGLFGFG